MVERSAFRFRVSRLWTNALTRLSWIFTWMFFITNLNDCCIRFSHFHASLLNNKMAAATFSPNFAFSKTKYRLNHKSNKKHWFHLQIEDSSISYNIFYFNYFISLKISSQNGHKLLFNITVLSIHCLDIVTNSHSFIKLFC